MTGVTSFAAGASALAVAAVLMTVPSDAAEPSYGRLGARDGTLLSGCHNYRYRYRVATPTNDWTLETFLRDPSGETIASGAYFSDSDPGVDDATFRFCRFGTRPGVFTIWAKVHWYDDHGDEHVGRLTPTRFRLSRPR